MVRISSERHRLIGFTPSSLNILSLLDFGPSREALVKAPLSGRADYTLDRLNTQATHTHLVSEPSPLQHKCWSGAWRRIAHCCIPEPCNHTHSNDCGHNQIGSGCLVALGFRGSPQFGCIANPTFENSAVELTSLVVPQALKLPQFAAEYPSHQIIALHTSSAYGPISSRMLHFLSAQFQS